MTVSKRLIKSRLKKVPKAVEVINAMGIDFDAMPEESIVLLESIVQKSKEDDRGLYKFIPDELAKRAYDPLEVDIIPCIESMNPIKILAIGGFTELPEESPEVCNKLNIAVTKMYISNVLREVNLEK